MTPTTALLWPPYVIGQAIIFLNAGLKCAARGSLEIQDAKYRHFGTIAQFVGLYLQK